MPTDWNDDEQLLADLGEAMRAADDVPGRFVEVGMAAFAWRSIDAELAGLTFDSAEPAAAGPSPGARAEQAPLRSMTFTARDLSIEVEVRDDALIGQIAPPAPGELDVRVYDGATRTVAVDEVGWFVIQPRPVGLFSLHVRTGDGAGVVTEWTAL
jgi:hypothetical protein